MNREEILNLIKTGEGYFLEFKEKIGSDLDKEICALANGEGGKIILGVGDSGEIVGYNLSNFDSSRIQNIVRNFDPAFSVEIESVDNLVLIKVPEGQSKPYSVSGKFYLRIGSNSQKMNRNELKEFFQKEGLIMFDEKLNEKFNLKKDLDLDLFNNFLNLTKLTNNLDKEIILSNLGLTEGGKLKNAGILFFCKDISRYLRQATISCVLYEGNTKTNIIDRKEFGLDILSNYENAYNFILSKLNTNYIISREREERLELPKEALREALVNAIVHRDYFSNGHVQVDIFLDRVEISNPGGLVSGLTEEDFDKKSIPRNPLLMDLMLRVGKVEKVGSGIGRIRDAMHSYGLKVSFVNTGFFSVIFERRILGKKSSEKSSEKILFLIKENSNVSAKKIAEILKISSRAVEKNIAKLKKDRLIERVGGKKEGYWRLLIKNEF